MASMDMYFEQIRGKFWYCRIGTDSIVVDRENEYFNATKLCEDYGKTFEDWKNSDFIQNLMAELEKINSYLTKFYFENDKNPNISGSYLPKEYLLSLLIWISPIKYLNFNNVILTNFQDEFNCKNKTSYVQIYSKCCCGKMCKKQYEKRSRECAYKCKNINNEDIIS